MLGLFEGAPSLLILFPLALDLLTQNLDLLRDIRLIVESYLLLDATLILTVCVIHALYSIPKPYYLFFRCMEKNFSQRFEYRSHRQLTQMSNLCLFHLVW